MDNGRSGNGSVLSWRQLGILAGLLTALAAAHAAFVVPGILHAAAEDMDKKLESHARHPHPAGVSQREMDQLRIYLDNRFDQMEQRFDTLEDRIRARRP